MITSLEDLDSAISRIFPDSPPPKSLNLAHPVPRVREDRITPAEAAREARTTLRRITEIAASASPLQEILGTELPSMDHPAVSRLRGNLGQLLIGNLAERVFEELYQARVGTSELRLKDDRRGRGDTDYLVINGSGRQIFRLNIKFHGSLFNRALELVGLQPEDCFALATYKIYAALRRQESEHLPYIFVIVGVPGLRGAVVGEWLPEDLVHLALIAHLSPRVTGKRLIEDQIVAQLTHNPDSFGVEEAVSGCLARIRQAEWRVLSARRANLLLRDLMFERAYALKVPRFAQNYPRAELDMHFSLSEDLRPLDEFLQVLRDFGMPGLVSRLERGTL